MQSRNDVFKWLPSRQRRSLNVLYWWLRFHGQQSTITGSHKVAAIARQAVATVYTRPKHVLFYPDVPRKLGYTMKKIMTILGYSPTNYLSTPTVAAIKWRDATFTPNCPNLLSLTQERRVVNGGLHDISKRRVDKVFQSIFGYSTFVDPTVHRGVAVQKSDINSRKDGQIIQCPVEHPLAGSIYQRLIDNEIGNEEVEDIRVPIIGQNIPFVYLKHRLKPTRFKNVDALSIFAPIHEVLSDGEIDKIRRFCRTMGMDYGELDVLRDRQDGKLYIIDANSTPFGPPSKMDLAEKTHAILVLAETFRQEFL